MLSLSLSLSLSFSFVVAMVVGDIIYKAMRVQLSRDLSVESEAREASEGGCEDAVSLFLLFARVDSGLLAGHGTKAEVSVLKDCQNVGESQRRWEIGSRKGGTERWAKKT